MSISGPNPDSKKVKPKPDAPTKCDPMLSFDAVTELRGETIVFKDEYSRFLKILWRHMLIMIKEATFILKFHIL